MAIKRNKEVQGSLKSSTNGGHFAHAQNSASAVEITAKPQLPPCAEHVPNPATGQTLLNGEPAPATFAEAWEQTFRPLAEAEARLNVDFSSFTNLSTGRRILFHGAGLESADITGIKDLRASEDGQLLVIDTYHSQDPDTECDHEAGFHEGQWFESEYTEEDCKDLGCGCTHCFMMYVYEHSEFEGANLVGERNTLQYTFRLKPGASERAAMVQAARDEHADLIDLRRESTALPWKILAPVGEQDFTQLDSFRNQVTRAEKATEELEKFRGFRPDGSLDRSKISGAYAQEFDEISQDLRTAQCASIPGKSIYHRTTDEERKAYFAQEHAKHEQVLAELEELKRAIGRELNPNLVEAALEAHSFDHKIYINAYEKGAERKEEILASFKAAYNEEVEASSVLHEKRSLYQHLQHVGAGWPDGTYDAPTRQDWRHMVLEETGKRV